MDKEKKARIRQYIDASSIPEELKVLYMMAKSTDTICAQSFNRIKSVYQMHGVTVKENPLLSGITDYCDLIQRATFKFFQRIEPQISDSTWGSNGAEAYDAFADDANEIARLIMLYVDRTARNRDGAKQVFDLLKSLPSGGIFSDKDIEKYRLK